YYAPKILGGLAILEDAFHNTAKLAAVRQRDLALNRSLPSLLSTYSSLLHYSPFRRIGVTGHQLNFSAFFAQK
ncbi:MAG: hypothetical protein ABSD28_09840, partial [Tepidisphaeraceae bacterium]